VTGSGKPPVAAVGAALGAAVLFGASTPVAKQLLGEAHPVMLAALFYVGSGIGQSTRGHNRRDDAFAPRARSGRVPGRLTPRPP
jgi:hypothetical protein